MRLGIKAKQVLGVTTIVGATVVVLSVMHLAQLAQVSLAESRARANLISSTVYQRANEVVGGAISPYEALRSDPGLRSILQSSLYSPNVTYAAIVDARGVTVVHADPAQEDSPLPSAQDLESLLARSPVSQLRAVYSGQGRNLDVSQALLLGDVAFGSIRIGVSTLLIRRDLSTSLRPAIITALVALGIAVFAAVILAQVLLRPIHVIRSGLTRLGQGELGVKLDLSQKDEFGELGAFFNEASQQLSADRSHMAGQVANLESAVEHLEDAVAIVSPQGRLLFANPALRTLIPAAATGANFDSLLPATHPLRRLSDQTLASRQSRGPVSATLALPAGDCGERMLMAHPVNDSNGDLVGIMIIVRNLNYLSQVQSTVRYSRKLAALGRLSAGVAHEVKNPLNSMMIHLELLRQHVSPRLATSARTAVGKVATVDPQAPAVDSTEALAHVDVIAGEIRRLDEVVQGFLKFTRPEDLKLQAVVLSVLLEEVIPIVRPEAERNGVQLLVECDGALAVNGDPAMLRQAFLNLALNACQAMPQGGVLRIACEPARGRRIAIVVADTGTGIKPDHLDRIFDLYFTTKPKGSGIGLSMVFRTIQMHDGEIEVQSILGKGTRFTILLPQAS
jgi:signal transduction histidine kinase